MKRLLIITEIIAPYRIPVFNALSENAGIDLHVIFLSETDPSLRHWRIYKDEIRFHYQVLPSLRLRMGRRSILVNRGLKKALAQFSPQTIICGGYNYLASWAAARWARRQGIPFLLWTESTVRDSRGGHVVTEWIKQKFVNSCDGFVVPGRSSFEYLKQLRVPENLIYTAPNAVDNDFFARASQHVKSEDAVYRASHNLPERFILCVGRLVPEKGIFDLLTAYAELNSEVRSAVALVFAGNGSAENDLTAQAAKIVQGRIIVLGFCQREELAALYGLAEVLVFPTHSDPWGLVVNEAMACGLPVVCSKVAGCAADLVQDGWNGRTVPPRELAQLSAAVESLLRDNDVRSSMSAKSRERIRMFSPEHCAQGLATAALAVTARGFAMQSNNRNHLA